MPKANPRQHITQFDHRAYRDQNVASDFAQVVNNGMQQTELGLIIDCHHVPSTLNCHVDRMKHAGGDVLPS